MHAVALLLLMLCLSAVPALASHGGTHCARPLRTSLNGVGSAELCMADWLRQVFARAECKPEIGYGQAMPPSRLLQLVEHGQLDFIVGASPLPERAKWGWFSIPYSNERVRLVATAKDAARWPVQRLCDAVMQKARVYGPAVGWYGERWAAAQNGATCGQISWYRSSPEPGGDLLKRGRVDLVLISEAVFPVLARGREPTLEMLPLVVSDSPVVMLFSRASVTGTDVAHINEALQAELQAHGTPCGLPAVTPSAAPVPPSQT